MLVQVVIVSCNLPSSSSGMSGIIEMTDSDEDWWFLVPCSRGLSISVGFPHPHRHRPHRPHHNHRQYGRNNANSSCSRGLSKGWAKKFPFFPVHLFGKLPTSFREIDVGSWPNKWTGKNIIFLFPTLYRPYGKYGICNSQENNFTDPSKPIFVAP